MTAVPHDDAFAPLDGITVLDLSRMLPGAVLARQLVDLGARLIKIEDPLVGDPMRHSPPQRGGVGVGFAAFFRGCESVALDLRQPGGRAAVLALARHADVLIESFRPGRMAQWGLDPRQLHMENPRLTVCSLPGFSDAAGPGGTTVGHDLNFVALSGLLDRVSGRDDDVPGIQLGDVATGMLAAQAILAALLQRTRTGHGRVFSQPLAAAPLPFVLWSWADAAAGSPSSFTADILGGACPAYGVYECSDGRLAVGCLEPKFWARFCERVGRADLAPAGLRTDDRGRAAREAMAAHLAARPVQHWMSAVTGENLPVTPVHDIEAARAEPSFAASGMLEQLQLPDGTTALVPGPALPNLGKAPSVAAPGLGQHTQAVLREFGVGAP